MKSPRTDKMKVIIIIDYVHMKTVMTNNIVNCIIYRIELNKFCKIFDCDVCFEISFYFIFLHSISWLIPNSFFWVFSFFFRHLNNYELRNFTFLKNSALCNDLYIPLRKYFKIIFYERKFWQLKNRLRFKIQYLN